MEKIKQALDRARTMHAMDLPLRPGPVAAAADREPSREVPPHDIPPNAAGMPATRTTVRAVDPEAIRRNRVLMPAATGAAARAYKLLRTQVLQRMHQAGYRSLAVVSADHGDGRTNTTVNLAIAIGEDADHTALVVDLDLRRPAVAQSFGITVDEGVDCCLRGERDAGSLLVAPKGYQGLVLLPASGPVPQSSELLSSDRTGAEIHAIVHRYTNRIVLFDVPPLLASDDALALLPSADAVLLVVHESRTRRAGLQRALELLGRTPVVGTVLNGSRELFSGD